MASNPESEIDKLMKKDLSGFRQKLYPKKGGEVFISFLWEMVKDFKNGCLIAGGLEYCIENMIMDPQKEIKSGKNKTPKLENIGSFLTSSQLLLESNNWFDYVLSNIVYFFTKSKNGIPTRLKTVLESFMEKVEEEKNRKNVKEEDFKNVENMKSFGVMHRYGVFLLKAIQCFSEAKILEIKKIEERQKPNNFLFYNSLRTDSFQKQIEDTIFDTWLANLTKYYFLGLIHRFFYLLNGFSNFESVLLSDYYISQFFSQAFLRFLFNKEELDLEIFLPKEKEYQPIYIPNVSYIKEQNILSILQTCGLLETEISKKALGLKEIQQENSENFTDLNSKINNIINNIEIIKEKWKEITKDQPKKQLIDLEKIPSVIRVNGWSNFLSYLNYGFKCDLSQNSSTETVYLYLIHLCQKSMNSKNLSIQSKNLLSTNNSEQSLFDEWKYFLCWNQILDDIYLNQEVNDNSIQLSSFCTTLSQFKKEAISNFFSGIDQQNNNDNNDVELNQDEKSKYKPFTFFITNGLFVNYFGMFRKMNTHKFLKSRFFFQSLIEICEFYRFPFFVRPDLEWNDFLALSQYFCSSTNIFATDKKYVIPSNSYNYIIEFLTSSSTNYKRCFIDFYNLLAIEEKFFMDRTITQSSFFKSCQKNIVKYSFDNFIKKPQSIKETSNQIIKTLEEKI